MSKWYVEDGHDRLSDISDAVDKAAPASVVASLDLTAAIRQHFWENRRVTNHGEYFGDPNYQWLAKVPGKIAQMLDQNYPGWDIDEKLFEEVCKKFPQIMTKPGGGI